MFPNDYFDGYSVLKTVVIYMSRIVRVPRMDAIHGQLSELHLTANLIVDIRHLYGVVLLKLKVLELKRNQIVAIEVHLMILPVAEYVTLTMNNMVEMPDLTQSKWGEELHGYERTNVMISEGNPWHCSTGMLWVLHLNCRLNCTTNNLHHRVDIIDVENMVCHSPADMTGKKITDVMLIHLGPNNAASRSWCGPSLVPVIVHARFASAIIWTCANLLCVGQPGTRMSETQFYRRNFCLIKLILKCHWKCRTPYKPWWIISVVLTHAWYIASHVCCCWALFYCDCIITIFSFVWSINTYSPWLIH